MVELRRGGERADHRGIRSAADGNALQVAAAHLIAQIALHQGRAVYVFTRSGDAEGQEFARELGVTWAGASTERAPEDLDAAIIFAPVGDLVPVALRAVRPGGTVVCAGIHMTPIPSFPYAILWGERVLRSVANLTRQDGDEFFKVASEVPLRVAVELLPLSEAPQGLDQLRAGRVRGAVVLIPPTAR